MKTALDYINYLPFLQDRDNGDQYVELDVKDFVEYMKLYASQALELAASEYRINKDLESVVDKQSILNIINELK